MTSIVTPFRPFRAIAILLTVITLGGVSGDALPTVDPEPAVAHWFCGAITKPTRLANGVAQFVCGGPSRSIQIAATTS